MYIIDVTMTPSNVILEDYNRPNQNYWTNQNLVYYELIWLLMRLDQTWMHFNLISSIWTSNICHAYWGLNYDIMSIEK
jgi:hypothetical protein